MFCVVAGRGVTLYLIPLYAVLVVAKVTQLLLDGGPDLAELALLTKQLFVKDIPVWDEDVLLLLERGQGRPGAGVVGGDRRRGLRDIFCHGTAESKVNFASIESVRPAVKFFFRLWCLDYHPVYSGCVRLVVICMFWCCFFW